LYLVRPHYQYKKSVSINTGDNVELQSINIKRLYLQVAEQLSALIHSGELKTGDRLPSERDLASRFSVSRPTIREALITLEVMGLVDVRPGSGVYIREAGGSKLELTEDLPGPFEILEARKVLESEIAAIAANRISDGQITRLKTLLRKMDDPEQSIKAVERIDEQFHMVIAEATGNSALVSSVKWLWGLRSESEISALFHDHARETDSRPAVDEHRAILAAVMQRDEKAARASMQRHLQRVIEDLTEITLD
jgi:DNA-binding FadR family transcriptional regulator